VQTYALYFAQMMLLGLRPRGYQNSQELVRKSLGKYPPFVFCLKRVGVYIFLKLIFTHRTGI
jgi:hypothetical protein